MVVISTVSVNLGFINVLKTLLFMMFETIGHIIQLDNLCKDYSVLWQ